MTTTVRITDPAGARAPGFEQPFEMLEACHERLHRTLDLLQRLRTHLAGHGADEQARQAAKDVLRYFDMAAPNHHQDEELHVFPLLLARGAPATVAVVRQLQREHGQMEVNWHAARAVLAAIAAGELSRLGSGEDDALDAFIALYTDHIRAEEDIAYPEAQAQLDEAALAAMGEEMRRRRGP